jgi:hypothetical protein
LEPLHKDTSNLKRRERNLRTLVLFALLCSFLIWAGSIKAEYDENLIIYFDYEEFKGDTVVDMSGHGHDGKINGKITQVDGKRGKAAKFESGSFLDLDGPNIPKEDIPTEAITIAAWINAEKTGNHHAIFNARASDSTWLVHPELRSEGNFRWLLRANGGATIFDIRAGAAKYDEWIHFAGTYSVDSGLGILYINGKEVQKAPGKQKIAGDWGLGARVGYNIDNARPFTGLMDDLSIWKKALTQDEIKDLMENGPKKMSVSAKGKLSTTWGKIKGF